MKYALSIKSLLFITILQKSYAADHLKSPQSPILSSNTEEDVWLPNSYGGITAIIIDLNKIGTDQLIKTQWMQKKETFKSFLGKEFKLHLAK